MHLTEKCLVDEQMSEDFMQIAASPKYSVYCSTSIGFVKVDEPQYRNGCTYRVMRTEEGETK